MGVCFCVTAYCARASLTLHSPVELLFPESRRTIRRTAGLERQKRKCNLPFLKTLPWLFVCLFLWNRLVLGWSLQGFHGGAQTGMDLPITRQHTPSSPPPKFWLSSLPLGPGAEESAELWRNIRRDWGPHVRTFGDKYLSERRFAALDQIAHGVSSGTFSKYW